MNPLIKSNLSQFVIGGRLFGLSSIGIFIFFLPVTVAGKQSIPLDHIVGWLKATLGTGTAWYAMMMILVDAIYPIISNE